MQVGITEAKLKNDYLFYQEVLPYLPVQASALSSQWSLVLGPPLPLLPTCWVPNGKLGCSDVNPPPHPHCRILHRLFWNIRRGRSTARRCRRPPGSRAHRAW